MYLALDLSLVSYHFSSQGSRMFHSVKELYGNFSYVNAF